MTKNGRPLNVNKNYRTWHIIFIHQCQFHFTDNDDASGPVVSPPLPATPRTFLIVILSGKRDCHYTEAIQEVNRYPSCCLTERHIIPGGS